MLHGDQFSVHISLAIFITSDIVIKLPITYIIVAIFPKSVV